MSKSAERTGPCALFMAFGTKGDVYPIAALAAAFACDQRHYQVQFVTHSAHENLEVHLGAKGVTFFPVSSLPVLSVDKHNDHGESGGCVEVSFSQKKQEITRKHRQECLSIVDKVYGDGAILDGDLIVINFFALEGWSLAELFRVRCVVAAPYVVPYSAPSSFERQFKTELPLLYQYLQEAPSGKICWGDIMQWMWPLFTDDWGIWRNCDLHLSFWPFTDPVTSLPTWHDRPASPLLLYGFSREIVDCPGYWPSAVRVCGFWFLPLEWQFSCPNCSEMSSLFSSSKPNAITELCPTHTKFKHFLDSSDEQPIFISFSSIGSMGYIRDPKTFLLVLETVIRVSSYRFILFSAGYEPLDAAIEMLANKSSSTSQNMQLGGAVNHLFDGRLLCFSGEMPYRWLFPQCAAVIHHGGSGSTAAALHAGVPQVICPFILDQFYWAERMHWLGVSPEPLKTSCLFPANENSNSLVEAATALVIAIDHALSSDIKTNAARLSTKLAAEDGVSMAMEIIKNEILRI